MKSALQIESTDQKWDAPAANSIVQIAKFANCNGNESVSQGTQGFTVDIFQLLCGFCAECRALRQPEPGCAAEIYLRTGNLAVAHLLPFPAHAALILIGNLFVPTRSLDRFNNCLRKPPHAEE